MYLCNTCWTQSKIKTFSSVQTLIAFVMETFSAFNLKTAHLIPTFFFLAARTAYEVSEEEMASAKELSALIDRLEVVAVKLEKAGAGSGASGK